MTVPAQPSSSSASAQQSGSSSSGQAPTFAHDTVNQGTGVTGLAGVFAERDAGEVARDIAEEVRSRVANHNNDAGHAGQPEEGQQPDEGEVPEEKVNPGQNTKIVRIRIVGDLSALSDITTLRILNNQVTQIQNQITGYVTAVDGLKRPGEVHTGQGLVAADLVTGAVGLLGVITQLVAGTYTYSGQSIPAASVGGLDILIAKQLESKALPVCVDRFTPPVPVSSNILTRIQDLQSRVAEDLNPAVTQAVSAAAAWTQAVANDKDLLTALDTALAAMLKGSSSVSDKAQKDPSPDPGLVQKGASPDPQLQKLENERDEVANRLTRESGPAAQAQNLVTAGQALATAVNAFVTAAVSAPAAGGLPPAARAARGEVLSQPGTALLYAQVIAAGDDQILRQDLFHNTWTNLTGLAAEYALMLPWQDQVLGSDLVWFYASRHGSMRKGLKNVVGEKRPDLGEFRNP
jgi:hypothetical protein